MPRRSVIALQSVPPHKLEKYGRLALHSSGKFKLLSLRCGGEIYAKAPMTEKLSLLQPLVIRLLMGMVVANQLAIDEIEHSGLAGAGVVVGGNNLIAESAERLRFAFSKELPRSAM